MKLIEEETPVDGQLRSCLIIRNQRAAKENDNAMPLHTHQTERSLVKASAGQDDQQGSFSTTLVVVQIGTATRESSLTLPSNREDTQTL